MSSIAVYSYWYISHVLCNADTAISVQVWRLSRDGLQLQAVQ